MNKKRLSQAGKLLFFVALVLTVLASFGVWLLSHDKYPFLYPAIVLGLFLLSFICMALGSRVGDKQ